MVRKRSYSDRYHFCDSHPSLLRLRSMHKESVLSKLPKRKKASPVKDVVLRGGANTGYFHGLTRMRTSTSRARSRASSQTWSALLQ